MTLTAQTEEITPEVAASYLELNIDNNRKISPSSVNTLSQRLTDGLWRSNGSTIKFNTDGKLIDGQHRLSAIIQSGIPMTTLVVRGVEPDALSTIDTAQKTRSAGDYLKMMHGDFMYRTQIASMVTALIRYERGARGYSIVSGFMPTPEQVNARYEQSRDIIDSVAPLAAAINGKLRLSPQAIGLILFLFWEIDTEDAVGFVDRVMNGVGLKEGDPLLAFRDTAIRDLEKPVHRRQASWIWAAMGIKAWNAYRKGGHIKQLGFRAGGFSPEDFPEPV